MEHTLQPFELKSIVQKRWPKLTKYVRACGPCWLLSNVPDKKAATGTITLVHRKLNGWEIASFYKEYELETVNKVTVSHEFAKDLGFLLLPDSMEITERHDGPGRPAKYDRFVARRIAKRRDRGESIRAIAKAEGMSPTTVQKLVATVRTPEQRKEIVKRNRRLAKDVSVKSNK